MRRIRDRHAEPGGMQYRLREKVFSIGDDFWVETPEGARAYKVNGKALRLRDTLELESPSGETLLKIQEKKLSVRDKMQIEHDGHTVATVKKALVGLRDRFTVDLGSGGELKATGNIVDHEYTVERDGRQIAVVSKRWFRARDTYGIEVAPDEDPALILAVAICIDRMSHD
jgi:uncharacterized protein YxjI